MPSITGLTAAATAWEAAPDTEKTSKYVEDVTIATATPWTITIAIEANANNGIPTGLDGQTITLSPNVNGATPTATSAGAIDWACGSVTTQAATARGLGNVVAGTLPAKYAPAECR